MTMTETRPEAAGAEASSPGVVAAPEVLPTEATGLAGWLVTADHKRIGRLYVVVSLLLGVAGLVVAALLHIERIDAGDVQLLDADSTAQLHSLYTIGTVFLFVVPLFLGFAMAVVPLQVGARSIAFPRAATASFWGWLVGSGILIGSYAANGGPTGGDADAVDLFLLSYILVIVSLLVATVCVVTTVLTLRAPGMSLDRTPMFSWASAVSGFMLLAVLPVLVANLVIAYVDHRYGRLLNTNRTIGGFIGWATLQPTTYLYALPVLGLIGDVVPTFAKARPQGRAVQMTLIGLLGLLGFGAYAQALYFRDVTSDLTYIVDGVAAAVPVLGVLALAGLTLKGGTLKLGAPLIGALLAGVLVLLGCASAALTGFEDLDLVGTTWQLGQADLLVIGAGLVGGLTALAFWGPKLWGRRLAEVPARGLALLGFLAVVVLGVPSLVNGFLDQPLGLASFETSEDVQDLLNALAATGAALAAVVLAVTVLVMARSFLTGEAAGDDPWDGQTLEWATTSPPPSGNFAGVVPIVTSASPLLDGRPADAKDVK